ncbi:EpsG family protein [Pedobacter boryungensis]|uniref:EpsG family protein n=1 Tax=Pedobacter boryungensis TaxID=869962 RepID=A0ABX2DF64_9SPHI|nr:EpsG family protein [Pedobacter boryungensis]NQX32728.1 EpsG family protein [Pedobacter boryungensis]
MFKKIKGFGLPLLFILPVAGFFTSLFNIRSKSSAFIYIAFAMLFGYAISFSDASSDSHRYAEAFSRFDNTLNYNAIVQLYRNGELRDMYRLLLFYFVSLFSNNPKVVYAFASLVYGIFSYLSLLIFVRERGNRWDKYVLVLGLIFFTMISLANVNSFRFNTGALVLFYSTYQFVIKRKTIWVLGILITPLFHYGIILMVPVLLLYKLLERILNNKDKINSWLFYAFVLAFAVSWVLGSNTINLGFLSQADVFSGAVGARMKYVNSLEVSNLVEGRNGSSIFLTLQKAFGYGIKIYVFVAALFIRYWLKIATGNKTEYIRLFNFILFFYTVAFIASSIPSGGRFLNIGHMFMILLLGKFYAVYRGKQIKNLLTWAIPVFSFHIAFINFMLPFLILSHTFWYGNLFWIIIEGLSFQVL